MRGTEQYNNPLYSNDLRDHIDRRNSVVEVQLIVIIVFAIFTCSQFPALTLENLRNNLADSGNSVAWLCIVLWTLDWEWERADQPGPDLPGWLYNTVVTITAKKAGLETGNINVNNQFHFKLSQFLQNIHVKYIWIENLEIVTCFESFLV